MAHFSNLFLDQKIRLERLAAKRRAIRSRIVLRIFDYEDAGKQFKACRLIDKLETFVLGYKRMTYPKGLAGQRRQSCLGG